MALPRSLLVAEPPHQADERGVLVVAQVVRRVGPVKNALVRPVAAELAAHQEAVGELVFERQR